MDDIQEQPEHSQQILAGPAVGSICQPLHVNRQVKIYPIIDHELEALDDHNWNAQLWTSVASASAALLVSCLWDMINSKASEISAAQLGFCVVCLTGVAAGLLLAHWYRQRRRNRLDRILSSVIESPSSK